MANIVYNSPNRLEVGFGIPVRVNLSVGAERVRASDREIVKLRNLFGSDQKPDLLMDLSVAAKGMELWQFAREHFAGPIGVLPHYLAFEEGLGLDPNVLLKRISMLIEGGVNFLTIHCTPTLALLDLAKRSRRTPITSRGGGLVVRDMILNKRQINVFEQIFEEICGLAQRNGCTLNLGTTFRSSSVADGLDAACLAELVEQERFVSLARKAGVNVVLEGPGHIQMNQIADYWRAIEPLGVLPMPLGPIVSDVDSNSDHVAAAIGAALLMQLSKGGIINAITRVEHKGGVPTFALSLEGLQTARVAAQAASLTYSKDCMQKEQAIANVRANTESCVVGSLQSGCSRCSVLCPLVHDNYDNVLLR